MGYDNFPLTTLEEKRKIITGSLENGWQLFFRARSIEFVCKD